MARKTVTTYTCDGCGKPVERPRDLRRFTLVAEKNGRNRYRDAPTAEVCATCEAELLAGFGRFVVQEKQELVEELLREPVVAA